jgi:uncharacterized protein YecT (DUF1311 family)
MMIRRLAIIGLVALAPAPALALEVSCPGPVDHVSVEAGPPTTQVIDGKEQVFPGYLEQDVGGDYDQDAPQMEWNYLNCDAKSTPVVAHCFASPDDRTGTDLAVPEEIKKCVYVKETQSFSCASPPLECPGADAPPPRAEETIHAAADDAITDRDLSRAYVALFKASDADGQERLQADEKAWLAARDRQCASDDQVKLAQCNAQTSAARTAELQKRLGCLQTPDASCAAAE